MAHDDMPRRFVVTRKSKLASRLYTFWSVTLFMIGNTTELLVSSRKLQSFALVKPRKFVHNFKEEKKWRQSFR